MKECRDENTMPPDCCINTAVKFFIMQSSGLTGRLVHFLFLKTDENKKMFKLTRVHTDMHILRAKQKCRKCIKFGILANTSNTNTMFIHVYFIKEDWPIYTASNTMSVSSACPRRTLFTWSLFSNTRFAWQTPLLYQGSSRSRCLISK